MRTMTDNPLIPTADVSNARIAAREAEIRTSVRGRGPQGNMGAPIIEPAPVPGANAPVAPIKNADGSITIPGKGTFKQLPNGNYVPVQ